MFEVTVRKKFRASHALTNYNGGCEEAHTHEFSVEMVIESSTLDKAGCAVDFLVVDKALDRVLGDLEGQAIHETKEFSNISSSAENIALHIFNSTSKELDAQISRVTVWEDRDHSATYFK
jgi:6-pyruvoyltetrahydropterin/6-carboxytetrahydropterin synthase